MHCHVENVLILNYLSPLVVTIRGKSQQGFFSLITAIIRIRSVSGWLLWMIPVSGWFLREDPNHCHHSKSKCERMIAEQNSAVKRPIGDSNPYVEEGRSIFPQKVFSHIKPNRAWRQNCSRLTCLDGSTTEKKPFSIHEDDDWWLSCHGMSPLGCTTKTCFSKKK